MADETAILSAPSVEAPASPQAPGAPAEDTSRVRQQSYAERKAAALADLNDDDAYFSVLREPGDKAGTTERAPADDTGKTAPPPATAKGEEHGPDEQDTERPAAKAQDEVAANNARRAQRDPNQNTEAAFQREVARLNQLNQELAAERQRLDFDNRILWETNERAKQIAHDTGAVAYAEIDDATRAAMVNQNAIRAQHQQAIYAQQAQQQQVAANWNREVASRNEYGKAARAEALNDVYATIAESRLPATRAEVEKLFREGYDDDIVKADIEMWQSEMTPAQIARSRIDVAMKRNAERVLKALTETAVKDLQSEHRDPPRFDRTQAYGGTSNGSPPARSTRDMPYAERVRAARQDFADSVDEDIRRLTG
jgi:hypothetical protein